MPDKSFRLTCANHPDTDAVEKCADCSKFFCRECVVEIDGKYHCHKCTDILTNLGDVISYKEKYNFRKFRIVIGGCFLLILAGIFAMTLLLIIPYIRLRPAIQCKGQLKQVYRTFYAYASDNNGAFPIADNDLTPLYLPEYSRGIDLFAMLKCPGTANIVSIPSHLKDDSTAVIGPGMSYSYKGGLKLEKDETKFVPLLSDQSKENHNGKGINILHTNGSVKFYENNAYAN
jgi:hypothetical protein